MSQQGCCVDGARGLRVFSCEGGRRTWVRGRSPRENGSWGRRGGRRGGGRRWVGAAVIAMSLAGCATGLSYRDTMVLAPMVRVSNLPLRLLALDHGADLVWSEEIVAQKLAACERVVNEEVGTVEYWTRPEVEGSRTRALFTTARERDKLVLQLGVGDAATALSAAQVVAGDVAALDINCGCPKHFSVSGGMGAALLKRPETIADIVKTLKRNLPLPVSCKIRLLETEEQTVSLMQTLERAGVDALSVHCRYVPQRSRTPAHRHMLSPLVQCVGVPVIGNGDVTTYRDGREWREGSGCAGVMVARGAVENTSCFRKEGLLPVRGVVDQHVKYCLRYDESYLNVKFIYQRHFTQVSVPGGPLFQAVTSARDAMEVAEAFDLGDWYRQLLADRRALQARTVGASRPREGDAGEEEGVDCGKKQKAAAWSCAECGEEFASRNALGRHCGETKHRKA